MERPASKTSGRRILVQIHLLAGVVAGLYLLFMSISGCALIFYADLYRILKPHPVVYGSSALSRIDLTRIITAENPGYEISHIWTPESPNEPVEVWMKDGEQEVQWLFNPYTGAALGPVFPAALRAVNWLKDFHNNLRLGREGYLVNALGASLLILVSATGLVVSYLKRKSSGRSRRLRWTCRNFDMHRTLGMLATPFYLMWGVTGIVLALESSGIRLTAHPDLLMKISCVLHFAAFDFLPVRVLWAIGAALLPVVVVTGTMMYWHKARVVSPQKKTPQIRGFRLFNLQLLSNIPEVSPLMELRNIADSH